MPLQGVHQQQLPAHLLALQHVHGFDGVLSRVKEPYIHCRAIPHVIGNQPMLSS